jgi:putative tributyrin esterase
VSRHKLFARVSVLALCCFLVPAAALAQKATPNSAPAQAKQAPAVTQKPSHTYNPFHWTPTPLNAPTSPSADDPIVRDETFHSAALARDMKYRVILPADYASSPRRYPVLYLLHGAAGGYSDWESRTNITQYVRDLPLIVVMPDGNESWYTNAATVPQDRFEDYIAKDLIQDVESRFRALATQHGRAIAGLSMGGYGATKFALKYPNQFAFAAAFSSAYHVPGDIDTTDPSSPSHEIQLRVFGPPGNPTREANNVFDLARKADPKTLPYLWISCGTFDQLLQSNREFVKLLGERGIAYEYHETAGAHTWQFWDDQLRAFLPELIKRLNLR